MDFGIYPNIHRSEGEALKTVVEKGSLRLVIMQRLVGPKCQVKTH